MHLKNDSTLEMVTTQIKGVDSTIRTTKGVLEENSKKNLFNSRIIDTNDPMFMHGGLL